MISSTEQTGRLEGEQQNQNDEQRGKYTDQQVVLAEGAGQIHSAGGVADNIERIPVVVFADDVVHFVHEGKGLVRLLGQIQIDDQTAVLVILQLLGGLVQLVKQIVQRVLHIARKGDVAIVHFLLQKAEHIVQRYFIIVQTVDNLAVFIVVHGVGTVQRLRDLVVQPGQLCQLARGGRRSAHSRPSPQCWPDPWWT